MKPIETEYAGYRFRSRLEARWAVFFDAAGIDYRYEPEGFTLPWSYTPEWSGRKKFQYLPDFYLPDLRMWGEVKADWTPTDRQKFLNAVHAMDKPFLVLGDIFQQPRGGSRRPFTVRRIGTELFARPWPLNGGYSGFEPDYEFPVAGVDLLRGHKDDVVLPEKLGWFRDAAREAQRARFEFGQTPGRPAL